MPAHLADRAAPWFAFRPLVVVLAAALLSACVAETPEASPHVVLIVWDTTRADHLGVYGYERDTTPNLDAIAADGIVFENAHTVAPWTVPSMASLFTGLLQHNHMVDWNPEPNRSLALTENVTTISEAMSEAGYATGLFTAQDVYTKLGGYSQGYDESKHMRASLLVARALRFFDEHPEQPVFLVLHWKDPHAKYQPRSEHDLWSDPALPRWTIQAQAPVSLELINTADVNAGKVVLRPEQYRQMQALYDGEIHQNDADLGDLWAGMQARGVADSTLFILVSDHGEAFGDHKHQLVSHGQPYETNQRIPLVMRYPRQISPRRSATLVRNIDIYPTILEIVGREISRPINGESLVPLFAADGADRPYIGATQHQREWHFLRTSQYKYLHSPDSTRLEIYDLRKDAREAVNLADDDADLIGDLQAQFDAFHEATSIPVEGAGERGLSVMDRKRLGVLGYLQ